MKSHFLAHKKALSFETRQLIARYSRRIRLLRIGIPSTAFLAMFILFIHYHQHYAFSPQYVESRSEKDFGIENQLIRATLMSRDTHGNPIVIKADKVVQKNGQALLKNTVSDLRSAEGQTILIASDQALYHEEGKKLNYQSEVTMRMDDGTEITTPSASVDLVEKSATGNQPVLGKGPSGTFLAEGFQCQGSTLHLTGKSKITFNKPAEKDPPEKDGRDIRERD